MPKTRRSSRPVPLTLAQQLRQTWSRHWFLLSMILILSWAAATRLYRLDEPKTYIFDEVYHAVTVKLIAKNDPRAYEWWNPPIEPNTAVDWLHPPLAKYTQALGVLALGENALGWRISSAVFGVMTVGATALLAQQLFQRRKLTLLAAFLASSDGLLLVQSRLAMNDIHVTFFIALTAVLYWEYQRRKLPMWLFLTGISAGLAMGSKWSGVFILGWVWIWQICSIITPLLHKRLIVTNKQTIIHAIRQVMFIGLIPITVYVLSYTHMFLQGKSLVCEGNQVVQGQCFCSQESSWWVKGLSSVAPSQTQYWQSLEARGGCKRLLSHFGELNHQIWWYQTHLTATHPYQSRPLEWFLDLRPVWMYVAYGEGTVANIYSFGNPILFWAGAVAVVWSVAIFVTNMVIKMKKKKVKITQQHALLFALTAYGIVWIPWQLSPRIMFFYHYTPAVPFLCVVLAYWLVQLWQVRWRAQPIGKWLTTAVIGLIGVVFLIWYPNWTGIPVPKLFADNVYFMVKSWR